MAYTLQSVDGKPAVFMDEIREIFPRTIAAKDRTTTTLKFSEK